MDASRAALLRALAMPAPLAHLWAQYLGMFRAKGRALALDRADRLMAELVAMLDEGVVVRNGNTRQAPLDTWRQALEQMVELRDGGKLQLPLKTHGYLLEIVFAAAERGAAQAERQVEETRRRGEQRRTTDNHLERLDKLARIRGDFEVGLIDRETAESQLRALGYAPEALHATR
ncbi:hypothetical protein KR767_04235 [Luteibacter anthropi]|uniref:hypothetical protein n=1 Tax=Luteibacter anthropi TaxID=564369 RepID=UPI002032A5D2|nr:hypothetical protein [Luteibacter anthropi]URX63286.1 hypothetical protein KR767_04235 [Luteibacter anthropi]